MRSDNAELLKEIGTRIRKAREENCYSRETVASMLGVSARTLAAYERGEREITTNKMIKLAEIYKTTFCKLVDFENSVKAVHNGYIKT